jgi:nitric oxide reductase NorE protein
MDETVVSAAPPELVVITGGRVRHVPGEPGVWMVLFGDMTVFFVLFSLYLHARGKNKELFEAGQDLLNPTLGAVNTMILLTSSLLVVLATRALRSERAHVTVPRLTLAGAAVGACFVAVKAVEYHAKFAARIDPSTNEFFMYYFALTGLHLAHVCVGLAILTALSRVTKQSKLSATQVGLFEGGVCFWHMVDLLWLVIYPLIFLVR